MALCVEEEQLLGERVLLEKFSAMESSLLQAWLDSENPELIKDAKLKPLVEARLREVANDFSNPQSGSIIKLGTVNQVRFGNLVETKKLA